jgi:hypothetical protein
MYLKLAKLLKKQTFNLFKNETCFLIQLLILKALQNEREIIIFINPYSGQKNVRSILNHSVIPLLKTAQLKYSVYGIYSTFTFASNFI